MGQRASNKLGQNKRRANAKAGLATVNGQLYDSFSVNNGALKVECRTKHGSLLHLYAPSDSHALWDYIGQLNALTRNNFQSPVSGGCGPKLIKLKLVGMHLDT